MKQYIEYIEVYYRISTSALFRDILYLSAILVICGYA